MDRKGLAVMGAFALAATLAGCGPDADGNRNLDTLDNELVDANSTGNARDPAIASALHDQIMVDPSLSQQANNDAVRPPSQPYSAQLPSEGIAAAPAPANAASPERRAPDAAAGGCRQCGAARQSLTLGELARRQHDRRTSGCASDMRYSARWAARLPADLPLYPDARVSEAAGSDSNGCAIRAVSFASAAPLRKVIDWYYARAGRAGYSAEHQADGTDHVLAGTRRRDEAAFALFVTSRADGGTDVDLIANNGR